MWLLELLANKRAIGLDCTIRCLCYIRQYSECCNIIPFCSEATHRDLSSCGPWIRRVRGKRSGKALHLSPNDPLCYCYCAIPIASVILFPSMASRRSHRRLAERPGHGSRCDMGLAFATASRKVPLKLSSKNGCRISCSCIRKHL